MTVFARLLAFAAAATVVLAQPDGPAPPLNANPTDTNNPRLVGKAFPFNNLPFMADTSSSPRGTQQGYNICNSTTEGPGSMCQTLIVNSLKDFCLWGPPKPNSVIGDAEGEVVAYCTLPGHGTRIIPPGTITGAQFIRTPSYIEFTGHINQANIDIQDGDTGGELDSGGQDNRGNPIGGLAYSNDLPDSQGTITQSRVWHAFMGSGIFCMKFCDNNAPNAAGICRHTLDTIGCNTNVPAAYTDGVFLSCVGADQDPVAVGDMNIPSSSDCTTFSSNDLWPTTTTSSAGPTTSTPGGGTGTGTGGGKSGGGNGNNEARARSSAVPLSVVAAAVACLAGVAVFG